MVGAVRSVTVTGNEPVALLPAASVALHCTFVVPSAKVEPDAGVQVTAGEVGLVSVAVAVHEATAPVGPLASTLICAGWFKLGAVESHGTTVADTCMAPLSL